MLSVVGPPSGFNELKKDESSVDLVDKVFPTIEELSSGRCFKCGVNDCTSVFVSPSQLNLHMIKHHRLPQNLSHEKPKIYFCPVDNCKYNYQFGNGMRSFPFFKYLKQHYQKSHAEKSLKCTNCLKHFATENLLNAHWKNCTSVFKCQDCSWTYNSREALLTHCRRKKHTIPLVNKVKNVNGSKKIVNIKPVIKEKGKIIVRNQRIAPKIESQSDSKEIQTEGGPIIIGIPFMNVQYVLPSIGAPPDSQSVVGCKRPPPQELEDDPLCKKCCKEPDIPVLIDKMQQTYECFPETSFPDYLDESRYCHIETQTERLFDMEDVCVGGNSSNSNSMMDSLDPLLYLDTHTQTRSTDYLYDFGLTDIETQTNWPTPSYNDLFVSTETQTNCLNVNLSACTQTTGSLEFLNDIGDS